MLNTYVSGWPFSLLVFQYYIIAIRGVFMLRVSTLLLREPCRLSVENLGFHTKLS